MTRYSIRVRLTVWYVAIMAVTTLGIVGASWWLSSQSVMRATDLSLRARVAGVQGFLDDPRTVLTVEALQDEFREYAELTRGEALLGVVDASGVVLCRPAVPGWTRIEQRADRTPDANVQPVEQRLAGSPFQVASTWIEARGRRYRVTVAAPMGPADAAIERFHGLLALLVPVVLLLAGAGGYWISRRALAPVDRITSAAQAMTVERLDRRLELPPADDELRRLASTFNDMLARLQSAVGEMARFTADASHELRTPVALVRTTAELSLRHERAPHEYRRALEDVLAYSRQMTGLVDDLLMLARTDAGIEIAQRTDLNLTDLAYEASRVLDAMARSHSVCIHVDVPDEPCIVNGDRLALRRLFMILLDNAVRYTPAGGDIRVRLSDRRRSDRLPPMVSITVTDSGIGIDPSEVPRLFERFFRGARARQRVPDGSGLGLAIARTIVERHCGSIAIIDGDQGDGGQRGCRVEVILPLELDGATAPSHEPLLRVAANLH